MARWAKAEAATQAERWALWAPVAFGAGAAIEFALPREPLEPVFVAVALLALAPAVAAQAWGRSRLACIVSALLAFGVCGFADAVVKTHVMAAPIAPDSRRPVTVEGWVIDVASASAAKPRLLLAPTYVSGLDWRDTPVRVRLALRPGAELAAPGSAVRMTAVLGPPPSPAAPGAYDFARDAWFGQIGGSGLALKSPRAIDLPPPPFSLRVAMAVNAARWRLANRLVDQMGPRDGGLAAALTTGHQAWLVDDDVQAMRDSGLAHILSISGVHMAIVGGFVFAAVRLLIAAWPWAALRVPGKKVAAGAALSALVGYLVLSGAPPPAIRSALTAGIALVAVLLDRRALTLHSLAVAALVVLGAQPEAIVQPGFQMSFAATAALLALAEAWPRRTSDKAAPAPIRAVQHAGEWLVAGLAVSLVAGLATDPFSIQHFNRITLWGLPANLGSELLSSFVVMPMLALGAGAEAIMPGWGAPFLVVAGWGLEGIAATAHLFAAAPRAVVGFTSAPAVALPISFFGLLVLCLLKTPLRLLGLPLFAAVWLWPRPPSPVAWVSGEGANVAVADGGHAVLLRPRSQRFAFELWAHRRGYAFDTADNAQPDPRWTCGRDSCAPNADAPLPVAGWWRLKPPTDEQRDALCRSAQIVVLRTGAAVAEGACKGRLVLDADAFTAGGAAELFHDPSGAWRVTWAQAARGDRPWSRAFGPER